MASQASSPIPRLGPIAGLPRLHYTGLFILEPRWMEPHVSAFAELLCILRGQTTLVLGRTETHAGAGDILFIPTGRSHRDRFDPRYVVEWSAVYFRWSLEARFAAGVRNDLIRQIAPPVRADLVRELDLIRAEETVDPEAGRPVKEARLLTVLLTLHRECRLIRQGANDPRAIEAEQRRHQSLTRGARDFIDGHLGDALTLDRIADALRVSPYHLSHVFSREMRVPLFTYIAQRRMQEALTLLRDGRLNVSEVAGRLGFDSSGYFARMFRRHYGFAPSQALRR